MSYADAYESRNSRAKAAISQSQRGRLATPLCAGVLGKLLHAQYRWSILNLRERGSAL